MKWFALAMSLLLAGPALGSPQQEPPQEPVTTSADQELEGILDGFDEESPEESSAAEEAPASPIDLGGLLRLGSSYGFAHDTPGPGEGDWRGLSRFRPELYLEATTHLGGSWQLFASGRAAYDLAYTINGRDDYTEQVLDRHEQEVELTDTYLSGRLGQRVDIKLGRQIVVWGTSENLRVTDILNPLDLREPGITDIEELRLPVAMTRIDVGAGPWQLTGLAIHEHRFHKTPAYGHEFYAYGFPLPPDSKPPCSLDSTELAVAAHGFFKGWDLAFYWARFYDDNPHLAIGESFLPELRHSRLTMIGTAWDLAAGDFLIKAEAAHFRELETFYLPGQRLARSELLAGLEYTGPADTWVTFEVVGRHLHGFQPVLELPPDMARENELDWVLRVSQAFRHQTLLVTAVAMSFGVKGDGGALQRLEARYDLNDRIEITGGVVLYQSGDRPGFVGIGDNDRLFIEIEFRF
jgi:hypothetical protein